MNLSVESFGVVRPQYASGRLPCRVNPIPLESPQGYLRRVAQTYRYDSVKCLPNLVGLKSTRGLERDNHAARLAHLLRLDPTELNSICYMKVTDNDKRSGRLFFGRVIGIDRLNNYKPRICPSCVKSRAVAWGIWDLGLVSACPTHGCLLIDRCPECSNRLSWCRPSVRECRCGYDLGATKSQRAEPLLVAINAVIYRAAGFPHGGETEVRNARFPSELIALQLDSLLRAICFVGVIQDPERPRVYHRRFSADVITSARLGSAAGTTLHDWPRSFHELLKIMMAQHVENPVTRSLRGVFGSLYAQLDHVYWSDEFSFIHRAFEDFLAKNWHGKRGRFFSKVNRQNSQWVAAKQAAILMQLRNNQVVDLVRHGELEGVFIKAGALGSHCWIKRESLNRWIEKQRLEVVSYVLNVEAGRTLGLHKALVLRLARAGLIRYKIGGRRPFRRNYYFHRDDVSRIKHAFEKHPLPEQGASRPLQDKLVTLRHGLPIHLGWYRIFLVAIRAVIDGTLAPVAYTKGSRGIRRFLFRASDLRELVRKVPRQACLNHHVSCTEAALILATTTEVIHKLAERGILTIDREGRRGAPRLLPMKTVVQFAKKYTSVSSLAERFHTSCPRVHRYLKSRSVKILAIPLKHQSKLFVRRKDVTRIHIPLSQRSQRFMRRQG